MAKGWTTAHSEVVNKEVTFESQREIDKMIKFAYDRTSIEGQKRFQKELDDKKKKEEALKKK